MPQFLLLVLEGPMTAFGAEAVDARGVVRDWPGASLLTGLLANALGYRRSTREAHARLQERIVFGVRIDRRGTRFTDFQTAALDKDDRGWTTRGVPEGRAGGAGTYDSPHIRERDHVADTALTVALRLAPAEEAPTLEEVAAALDRPARPLFLGRKSCPPARPLNGGFVEAESLAEALLSAPSPFLSPTLSSDAPPVPSVVLPDGPGIDPRWERIVVSDRRDWIAGVHAGSRVFRRGTMERRL